MHGFFIGQSVSYALTDFKVYAISSVLELQGREST